jgi:hypothetical protein
MKRDSSCDPQGFPGTCRKVYAYLNAMTGPLSDSKSGAAFSTANYLFDLNPYVAGGNYSKQQIEHIADFDGDGLPDFFLTYTDSGYVSGNFAGIRLTRVNGGIVSTQAAASPLSCSGDANECDWNSGTVAHWMDVNGDGLEDFVFAKPNAPTWHVRLNKCNAALAPPVDTGSGAGLQTYTTTEGQRFRYANRFPSWMLMGTASRTS